MFVVLVVVVFIAVFGWAFAHVERQGRTRMEQDGPDVVQRGWTVRRNLLDGSTVQGTHGGRAFEARRRERTNNRPASTRITVPYRPAPGVPPMRWRSRGGAESGDPVVEHVRRLGITHLDAPKGDPPAVRAEVRGYAPAVELEQLLDALTEIVAALETGRLH
jgi:hypothetical protein